MILDRAGRVLASNRPAFMVTMLPHPAPARRRAVERELEPLLGLARGALERRFGAARMASGEAVAVAEDVDYRTVARVEEHAAFLPGVSVQAVPVRCYPYGALAAHALGYVGEVDREELARLAGQGYRQGDRLGKSGVERAAEGWLRGREGGWQVEVDARGRVTRELGEVAPRQGRPVVLTLDLPVQQAAEAGLRGRRGAAVALDPQTGELLALCSSPGFDPNWFARGLQGAQWRYLNGRARPQQNRALAGRYEPGSVFKIITAAAALEAGQVEVGSRFFCPGYFRLGRWQFGCWRQGGHGPISFLEGVAQSCNVVFMTLGRRVGAAGLAEMAHRFGLGQTTGVELGSESRGLVPDPGWKREHRHQPWYPGDTCQMAIGQGDLLLTPLQAAVEVAAVANGGRRVRPHLLKQAGGDRVPAPDPQPLGLRPETVSLLQQGLEAVVAQGTGQALGHLGVRVAGKTGTAQNPHGPAHAWFVGYAPAPRPRVAVAVLVEGGGHGGATAGPIAGRMISAALRLEGEGARHQH